MGAALRGVAALGQDADADAVRASGLCCRGPTRLFIELLPVYLGYALWEFSVAESYMESIGRVAQIRPIGVE